MALRSEFEDPFEATLEALSLLGFDPRDVAERGYPDSLEATTPRGSVVEQFQEGYGRGRGTGEPKFEEVWDVVEHLVDAGIPSRFGVDTGTQAHEVAKRLTLATDAFGYEVDVSFPAQPESKYPELSTAHPEVIVVTLSDATSGDTVADRPIRLFPCATERVAVTNCEGMAACLNRALLFERNLEIARPTREIHEYGSYRLFERSTLDALEAQYGEGLPLVDGDEPLLTRGFLDSLGKYEPENETDHERLFGIPEPSETFRLEESEAGRSYLNGR